MSENTLQARKSQRKRHKKNVPILTGTPRPKKRAVRPLKNRIRDLRRLLNNVHNLPADIRVEHERELEANLQDLAVVETDIRKQDMLKRYHMVRFFGLYIRCLLFILVSTEEYLDRRKATRRLKQARKALEAANSDKEKDSAGRNLHIAEVNLNYSVYYPLQRPYCALFPRGKGNTSSIKGENTLNLGKMNGDRAIWHQVESAMKLGTLEDLRNSSSLEDHHNHLHQAVLNKKMRYRGTQNDGYKSGRANVPTNPQLNIIKNKDAVSDDGFFERPETASLSG